MKILKNRNIALLLVLFTIYGCYGYNKILKDPNHANRYKAALKYYNAEKYAKSTPLFESVEVYYGDQPEGDTVKFYIAKGYFLMSDYYSAESELEQFTRTMGNSHFAEEAYYLRAVNLYKMSSRSELDQRNTIDAITAFNVFKTKYPNSEFGAKEKDYLDELIGRLEQKVYLSAKLYYHIEDYKAAIVALRNSIKEFPNSRYNEEQSFLVLKSNYIYAKKSIRKMQPERYIATIDEYYNFVSEYPDSKYIPEAEVIYKDALSYTQKRGINIEDEIDR
ncbi:MAG: outer membrane protein assembly factor BamD [Prevotellaceae bacterium]|jgi:outer membrane protein assembly factor BamD|nr:outer membrane protein assembly factor BamD [Prevotellaceae bacterium]